MTATRVRVSDITITQYEDGTVHMQKHGVDIRSLGKDQVIGLLMKEVQRLQETVKAVMS